MVGESRMKDVEHASGDSRLKADGRYRGWWLYQSLSGSMLRVQQKSVDLSVALEVTMSMSRTRTCEHGRGSL